MKITCSILCYNYGHFLPQAIESCLNQSPDDYELEVLVIDDGSTDDTPDVCRRYEGKIRVLRSENQGFGASLDKSIRDATGDYVCILDADDYFAPHKIKALMPHIRADVPYICHDTRYIDENGNFLDSESHGGGNTSTLCLKRSVALGLLPAQNEIFFRPLFDLGYGAEIHEPLTFYRIHGNSMSNGAGSAKTLWLERHAKVCYTLAEQVLSPSPEFRALTTSRQRKWLNRQYRANALYDEVELELIAGQRSKAIASGFKMLWLSVPPINKKTKSYLSILLRALRGQSMFAATANGN